MYSNPPKSKVTFRNTCDNNLNNFKNALRKEKWNFNDECLEPNIAYNKFIDSYTDLMNEHLPIVNKTFKRKKHKITPWIIYRIFKSINTRNKLLKNILI